MNKNRAKIEIRLGQLTLLVGAMTIMLLIYPEPSFALQSAKDAIKELCGHMEGQLGGLLMTTAAVGAIVAAAFGNFKACYSMIIVGVGAFAISSMLSLYFPEAANICSGNTGGNGITQLPATGGPAANTGGNVARQYLAESAIAIANGQTADFSKAAAMANPETVQVEKTEEFDEDLAELVDTF